MALLNTDCPNLKLLTRGKVRDIYEIPGHDDKLLFVATDRISAFDILMKNGIPNKGRLLTSLSLFFFNLLSEEDKLIPNHVITGNMEEMPTCVQEYKTQLVGRSILVKKCQVLKCEAIVRGYLTGSALVEYKKSGTVHGIKLEEGLQESSKFPEPIFTPSTKAELGDHDENIHPDQLAVVLGSSDLAFRVETAALSIFKSVSLHALRVGSLILADTKFEFGLDHSSIPPSLTLIDECLTPDSSRFWSSNEWNLGKKMVGLDKQFLRDWLLTHQSGFEKTNDSQGIEIPRHVIDGTWAKYKEAYLRLTGKEFEL